MQKKPIKPIQLDTPFAGINPALGRQLYRSDQADKDGLKTLFISNEEIESSRSEIEGRVLCACDGSAETVNNCLNNSTNILSKIVRTPDCDSKPQDLGTKVEFRNDRGGQVSRGKIDQHVIQLLNRKMNCSLSGLDALSVESTQKSDIWPFVPPGDE